MIDWELAEKLWNQPYEPQKEKQMVKRTVDMPNEEPENSTFKMPSEQEHLLQVVDIYTCNDETGTKLGLDDDTVSVKLEVVGGEEEGLGLLCRLSLDENSKGFFATRLFLKAIGDPHKGSAIEIDTDRWVGRQFFATVIHNASTNGKTYANIDTYNFDKKVEQNKVTDVKKDEGDIAWEE